jgi:hypothetical protein
MDRGFVKIWRKIKESEVYHSPPHIREIWNYLLIEANYKESKKNGMIIGRGQCLRSYRDIQDDLHWTIGWRKMSYSKGQCEIAMKYLKKHGMIATKKTTRGLLITVLNYNEYQWKPDDESHTCNYRKATRKLQESHTLLNKNVKNVKNKEIIELPDWLDFKVWSEYKKYRQNGKSKFTPYAQTLAIKKLEKLKAGGDDPTEVIKQSILMGWSGLFPIKKEYKKEQGNRSIASPKTKSQLEYERIMKL